MSLERRDIRAYFDPSVHALLVRAADIDGMEPAHLIEAVMQEYIVNRFHSAMMLVQGVDVAGIARLRPVAAGLGRSAPDAAVVDRPLTSRRRRA